MQWRMAMTRHVRFAALSLAAACSVAASCDNELLDPPTEFLAVRRAWRPGERDSVVASIIANRTFFIVLPAAGAVDFSDDADALLPTDSTTDIIPNPDYDGPPGSLMGPSFSVNNGMVPGGGWTTYGIDIAITNNNPGEPDFNWLGMFWYLNSDPTRRGFLLAATAAATFPATLVNTTAFDASGAMAGVGGGEFRTDSSITWLATGGSAPNTFRVVSTTFAGGFTTITTGPFTGGQVRGGTMNVQALTIRLNRVGGGPFLTVNISGGINALQYNCVFPTPCTTNSLREP